LALSRRGATALTAALGVAISLLFAGPALGADQRLVKMQDDCDPATFNAAVGPGTCVGNGRTTFQELLAQFFPPTGDFSVDRWQFSRPDFNIDAGGTITVRDDGGEFHTFTHVSHFGNGCSPLDNGQPVAGDPNDPNGGDINCLTFDLGPSGLLPGQSKTVTVDQPGTMLFQCMIHPWMRSTVDVRADRRGRG
jgi:plastocyanin